MGGDDHMTHKLRNELPALYRIRRRMMQNAAYCKQTLKQAKRYDTQLRAGAAVKTYRRVLQYIDAEIKKAEMAMEEV